MNEKIQEILSVLDMSEEERHKWLADYFTKLYFPTDDWPKWYGVCDILLHESGRVIECLSHLAFMLRDEVVNDYHKVIQIVHEHEGYGGNRMYAATPTGALSWFVYHAQPIHWIVAALIAKELEKEN